MQTPLKMLLAQSDLFFICFLFVSNMRTNVTFGGSVVSGCHILAHGSIVHIRDLLEQFLLITPSRFAEHVTAALPAGKTVLALMKIVPSACSVDRGRG